MAISQIAVRLFRNAAKARRGACRLLIPYLVPALCMMSIPELASAQTAATQGSADGQPRDTQSQQAPSAIYGTVKDSSGSIVAGAIVTLETTPSPGKRTTITDESGSFHFSAVNPGNYKISIGADGFSILTMNNLLVRSGESHPPLSAVLQVAPASTRVDVALSRQQLATEQLKTEEKQRLLGLFPNYFVSYEPNAAPLNAAQKFQLGWKTIIDPVVLLDSGISAGLQQWRNSYHEFSQGMEGYGKRFGAQYADGVSGIMIGNALMQSIFHQDPRYFYKGTGPIRSRVLYAIATAFVCKGDNGHWQPDYSDVLGGLAAGEISTLYYPASSRSDCGLLTMSCSISAAERQAIYCRNSFSARRRRTCHERR